MERDASRAGAEAASQFAVLEPRQDQDHHEQADGDRRGGKAQCDRQVELAGERRPQRQQRDPAGQGDAGRPEVAHQGADDPGQAQEHQQEQAQEPHRDDVVNQVLAPDPVGDRRGAHQHGHHLGGGECGDPPGPGDRLRGAVLGDLGGVGERVAEGLGRRAPGGRAAGLHLAGAVSDHRPGNLEQAQFHHEAVAPLPVGLHERALPDIRGQYLGVGVVFMVSSSRSTGAGGCGALPVMPVDG
jgi:hypothetical protein